MDKHDGENGRQKVISKIEGVQALRFVAAAMVLVTHLTFYLHERVSRAFPVWDGGAAGVSIFFVISGIVIVIAAAKLEVNRAGSAVFLRHRIARIVPLYWLITTLKVVLALAIPAVVLHNHFDVVHAVKSYLFIPAFNQDGQIRPIHGVGWTLLHEMYFYLLFSLAMYLGLRPAVYVGAFICIAYVVGKGADFKSAMLIVATSRENLHFVLGMIVGSILLRNTYTLKQAASLCVVVLLSVLLATRLKISVVVDPLALAIAASIPLIAKFRTYKAAPFFSSLGESSYSLYLIHPIVAAGLVALLGKLGVPAIANLIIAFCITVGVGHLVHLYVEKPMIKAARKWLDNWGAPKDRIRVASPN